MTEHSKAKTKPMKPKKIDRELEEFRNLMQPPGTFEDGFTWSSLLGALFVALLMVPGSIYMTLLAGQAIGPAAQWVTLILFIEVARRANRSLRKAEIFTLFYISGAIMVTAAQLQGGFHGGLGALWSQFFVQSDAAHAQGLVEGIPEWVAPSDPNVLAQRSLWMKEWLPAIGLIAFTMIIGRLDNLVLGYGLFRVTSDIEKLPFPMAPVGAQGVLALSEEQDEESRKRNLPDDPQHPNDQRETAAEEATGWRWRVFSMGSIIGLIFGAIYLGVPTVTGALLERPITLIPLPFVDYTQATAIILPAVAIAISLNLGQVVWGMVLPFWAMVGSFVGLLVTVMANPLLYHYGVLSSWNPGDRMQETIYKNNVDFYFSFSIGIALVIALAGFISVGKALVKARAYKKQRTHDQHPGIPNRKDLGVPEGRGDIRPRFIILTYLITTALYIGVSCWLLYISDGSVHMPLLMVMLFYALIYTPIISYVTARLEGIAGEVINIPFVREGAFILSGYQGLAVWFLPVPLHNYGSMTVLYRQCELTGTKFGSIWKAEFFLTPIILIGSLVFAHFIWSLGEIPSASFPFAQEWWEITAEQQALVFSSTTGQFSEFEKAFRWDYLLLGLGLGSLVFSGLARVGAPIFLTYGIVRGLNQTLPFVVVGQFVGALIGRFYFQKRFGRRWRQYIPVLAAGFSCGMGLIGTLGIGFTFLAKAVFKLPY